MDDERDVFIRVRCVQYDFSKSLQYYCVPFPEPYALHLGTSPESTNAALLPYRRGLPPPPRTCPALAGRVNLSACGIRLPGLPFAEPTRIGLLCFGLFGALESHGASHSTPGYAVV